MYGFYDLTIAMQISSMAQSSTVDIAFISGIDDETDKMEGRTDALTGFKASLYLQALMFWWWWIDQ